MFFCIEIMDFGVDSGDDDGVDGGVRLSMTTANDCVCCMKILKSKRNPSRAKVSHATLFSPLP